MGSIYPAHAGINRPEARSRPLRSHLPRTRGDKPLAHQSSKGSMESTPHTRG